MKKFREFLQLSGQRPANFYGSIRIPPSKSYFHRALFIASLCSGESQILLRQSDLHLSDDMSATIRALRGLGAGIKRIDGKNGVVLKVRGDRRSSLPREKSSKKLNVGGSGTTARFLISLACLCEGTVEIVGDSSLSKRPMGPILDSLKQLGGKCRSKNSDGKLPVIVEGGGGLRGGTCTVGATVSSQFLSSLLIVCTRARNDCTLSIKRRSQMVSEPYVEATLTVLRHFGFDIKRESTRFVVKRSQIVSGRIFEVPADASTAASVGAAAIASRGKVRIYGLDSSLPQADNVFWDFAKHVGAKITLHSKRTTNFALDATGTSPQGRLSPLRFDMRNCPDLVPVAAGVAAALGIGMKITNVGHVRFKESDRLSIVARELRKLGVQTKETKTSIEVLPLASAPSRKPIFLDPASDHRILIGMCVASLSGRFGRVLISDPECVAKSYPNFVRDLKMLTHDKDVVKIVRGD